MRQFKVVNDVFLFYLCLKALKIKKERKSKYESSLVLFDMGWRTYSFELY